MQVATEAIGAPFGRPLNVADMNFAADVDVATGMTAPTLQIADIEGLAITKPMGVASICPVATGACVGSTTGGDVTGWDMYGQLITETVAAAGVSTIAFAGIVGAPDDAVWVNQFGLPYKYLGDAASPNADVTITAPDPAEDARGTFAFGGTFVDTDPMKYTEVEVPYIADRAELMGAPYASRFETTAAVAETVMVGTIDNTGAIAITTTLIADDSTQQVYSFPDGGTVAVDNGAGTLNYTLSPLWMSKYARNITDVDTLVSGSTNHGSSIAVNLTGSVALLSGSAPTPTPTPTPPPALPASFNTHADANGWLAAFNAWSPVDVSPDGWGSMTLTEKHTICQTIYDEAVD